jgi:hypothetical protein
MCGTIKHTLESKKRIKTRLKLNKPMAIPEVIYGQKLCEMTATDKSHLEVTEMRFPRSTLGEMKRLDRIQVCKALKRMQTNTE